MKNLLSNEDYKLIERLVSLTQDEVRIVMSKYIRSIFGKKNSIITKDYIIGIGNIPIALVSHMDTVFSVPVETLYYDQKKGVMWSPEGLGADDRAGIFGIIKILQSGYRPSIILTTDEESGGLGAEKLSKRKCPIPNLKYMIELDRRGKDDCVFYDCYCPEFIDYVESFGFIEQYGSFSDISFLMGEWDICGVNLSIGYEDEHSYIETLHIKPMLDTISKVKKMLDDSNNIEKFEYKELDYKKYFSSYYKDKYDFGQHCAGCGKIFSDYDLTPVKIDDNKLKYFCPDCLVDKVEWCLECGSPFQYENSSEERKYCKECEEAKCTKTSKNNLLV